jgi:O-antigen ligase
VNEAGFATRPAPGWSERCLDVSRGAAVAGACAVTFSSALTSIAAATMVASWALSGRAIATLGGSLRQPLGIALAIFLALVAAGMLYSSAPWTERLHSVWGWRKLGYGLLLLGFFASDEWKRRFIGAFLLVACVGVIASFLAALGLIPSRPNQIAGTIQGVVFQNHSVQGIVFSLAILCLAYFARNASWRLRWAFIAFAVAFVINIAYILPGRSGYVALIIATFASAAMLFGWRRIHIWLSVGIVLAALIFATAPQLRERVLQVAREVSSANSSPELTSMGIRVLFYRTTLELIRDRPVFGYGSGSFGKEYSALVVQRYRDWRATSGTDPHSQYLFVTMELGIVGLVAFLAILAAGFWSAHASRYGCIAGGALAIWCVTSLFSSHFRTFPEGHLIGFFLGALLAAPQGYRAHRASS